MLTAGLTAAFVAALFFVFLARAVMAGSTTGFDAAVRGAVHSWASPALTSVMRAITQLGSVNFLVPAGAVVAWRLYVGGRPRAAVLLAITAVGAQAFDQVLKFDFRRPRPEVFFGAAQPSTYSFPSGHSVESCCFYGVLAAILAAGTMSWRKKGAIWAAASAVTVAVGLSRVYLGVHYPTDVVGGWALAIVWVGIVRAAYELWLPAHRK